MLCGLFTGEFFGLWVLVGSLKFPKPPQMLPTSTDQCPVLPAYYTSAMQYLNTTTSTGAPLADRDGLLQLYHIAYLLVPVFGCLISLTVGLIVSLLTGRLNFPLNPTNPNHPGGYKEVHRVPPDHLSKLAWKLWPSSLLPTKHPMFGESPLKQVKLETYEGDLNANPIGTYGTAKQSSAMNGNML